MEGIGSDVEEENKQINLDPEELKRLEKEKRMQSNLAKFNRMLENEQIMGGNRNGDNEEHAQINVDPEEIKRQEKEKRMQANLAKFNMDMQLMGQNMQDYY